MQSILSFSLFNWLLVYWSLSFSLVIGIWSLVVLVPWLAPESQHVRSRRSVLGRCEVMGDEWYGKDVVFL